MKMPGSHSGFTAACAFAGLFLALPVQAQAQAQDEDFERTVTIMRACSQIEEMVARVTCYDNNIGPSAEGSVSSGSDAITARPQPVRAAVPAAVQNRPQGFGSEMLPQAREEQRDSRQDEIRIRVSAVERLQRGIYRLSLEDGAQWDFVEEAAITYDPPREGSEIRIMRGALGSFLMRYDGQTSQRVRRIR